MSSSIIDRLHSKRDVDLYNPNRSSEFSLPTEEDQRKISHKMITKGLLKLEKPSLANTVWNTM
jgi:hypothetical protein